MIREQDAARFTRLALDCVDREYPNKIAHLLHDDEDVLPPRVLTPAFYGCYDWHSAVHGHWLLARLSRLFPEAGFAREAQGALKRHITPANIAAECAYLSGPGREAFERPYGLAWLLALAAELRGTRFAEILAPLEHAVIARFKGWLPRLPCPDRSGQHANTAFALALAIDASTGEFRTMLEQRTREFFLADRNAPAVFEPSGEDFLSPILAEANVMRRVLDAGGFARWLGAFLPEIEVFEPVASPDPSDPKFSHLDGLNLSRAWMLRAIARGLPEGDPRAPLLESMAARHGDAGLGAVTGEHYVGSHWLATFAVYFLTGGGNCV